MNAVAENFTPVRQSPKVGDSVAIKHQVKRSGNGDVVGLQRVDGKPYSVEITAVYLDGTVRTGTSDVWEVKLAEQTGSRAKWETVNPFHGKE